jgi:hypothetical protein
MEAVLFLKELFINQFSRNRNKMNDVLTDSIKIGEEINSYFLV